LVRGFPGPRIRTPGIRQSWKIGYPHPYFGRKVVVFLRLQTGLRCKIVKTKEFPAKSSRIRSYVVVSATSGNLRLDGGAKRTYQNDDLKEVF
jgi:hypothetical protein